MFDTQSNIGASQSGLESRLWNTDSVVGGVAAVVAAVDAIRFLKNINPPSVPIVGALEPT